MEPNPPQRLSQIHPSSPAAQRRKVAALQWVLCSPAVVVFVCPRCRLKSVGVKQGERLFQRRNWEGWAPFGKMPVVGEVEVLNMYTCPKEVRLLPNWY
jgi:hypothetical protein